MITGRGGGFLLASLALWGYAVVAEIVALAVVGGVLLLWFFFSWILFLGRVRLAGARLRLERRLRDEQGEVDHLWAGLPYRVWLRVTNASRFSLPFVVVVDRTPYLAAGLKGEPHASGSLAAGESVAIDYEVKASAAGGLRFEGVKVLVSDLEGFFACAMFLRRVVTFRCLPPLADARGHVPVVKRLNILPLLGQHPHRRPGSGSELLELRDYLPGDPPKRIAWKISARRDRLMTREVESEAPIRCSLFVDTSDAVRVGVIGRNALARLIEIAAAVVQANGAARDPTGVCLFDEQGVVRQARPDRSRRRVLEIIQLLAEHADLFPRAGALPLSRMIPLAYGLAQDLYPELLHRDVNPFPWWLPLWSPRPAYLDVPAGPAPPGRLGRLLAWVERRLQETPLGWLWTIPRRFSPRAHRTFRQRKQLAAILAGLQRLGPAAIAELLDDDDLLRDRLTRFLSEHGQGFPARLYDEQGRYAFASHAKVNILARALLAAVQRGKDDELFVLLVDLMENEDLEPLLGAIRVARARHHQVIVVCPWPDGIAVPSRKPATEVTLEAVLDRPFDVEEMVRQTTEWRLHQAYERLRRRLGRAGVSLLCAAREDTPALILERMHRLRVLQRGAL